MDGGRIAIALGLAAVAVAVTVGVVLGLMPPDRLSLAAGRPGSAYHAVAERYALALARDRLTLKIRETEGSAENAALLASGAVDAAIVQGGVPVGGGAGVEALAGPVPEAVLICHRSALDEPGSPADRDSLSFAGGVQGSGTRTEPARLTPVTGFRPGANTVLPLGGRDAAGALLAGRADAALFVAPLDAPYLAPLFADRGVRLAAIADPEALVRRVDHLVPPTRPAAPVDYPRRVPDRPVTLLTMPARLVARDDLHPAHVDRLVEAARDPSRRGAAGGRGRLPLRRGARAFPSTATPRPASARARARSPISCLGGSRPRSTASRCYCRWYSCCWRSCAPPRGSMLGGCARGSTAIISIFAGSTSKRRGRPTRSVSTPSPPSSTTSRSRSAARGCRSPIASTPT